MAALFTHPLHHTKPKFAASEKFAANHICRLDSANDRDYGIDMIGALEILRRERDEAAEQIRALRMRIKDLDAAIGVLEGQPTTSKQGRTTGDLKLSVLSKLKEAKLNGGTPKELADALTAEGRPTSDASVSSTLSRLKAESKVLNRNGRWFAASDLSDPQDHDPGNDLQQQSEWDDLDEDVPF